MEKIKELINDGKEVISNGKEIIEDRKEMIEDLFEKTEEYIKTNVHLIKLKAVDKAAGVVGSLVAKVAVIVLGFFFLMMINFGIAMWLGEVLGKMHYGFMIVAGFYALLTLIVYLLRDSIIKTPISNSIISQMLK